MARFDTPKACGVAAHSSGNVYVVDTANHTIRRITSTGAVTTVGGTVNSADASTTGISSPQGVAVNSDGTIVYVAGTGNHTIRRITSTGAVSTLLRAPRMILAQWRSLTAPTA